MAHPDLLSAEIQDGRDGRARQNNMYGDIASKVAGLGVELANEMKHGMAVISLPHCAPYVCLAAVSWALSLTRPSERRSSLRLKSMDPEALQSELHVWRQFINDRRSQLKPLCEKAPYGFGWISAQNDSRSRVDRLAAAAATLREAMRHESRTPPQPPVFVNAPHYVGAAPVSTTTISYGQGRALDVA